MQNWILAALLVITATQTAGCFARRLHQPSVIGELVGGLILGPAVFGQILPTAYARVFSSDVREAVGWLAEIGVIFFCTGVGCELRALATHHAEKRLWRLALPILTLGGLSGITLGLLTPQTWIPDNANRPAFVLFTLCAVTVTAVPVLAMILRDLGLTHQRIGVAAMAVAGVGDVICWIILTVATDLQRSFSWVQISLEIVATLGLAMFGIMAINTLARIAARRTHTSSSALIIFLVFGSLGTAYLASLRGIHPAIAAVVFGLLVPAASSPFSSSANALKLFLQANSRILLPFFMVGVGLSFEPSGGSFWWYASALAISLIAVSIKLVGALMGGRCFGINPWTSVRIGMLLSTRGLTEVLVLNIGRTAGLIDEKIFNLGLVVTVVTTLAATPGYQWATRLDRSDEANPQLSTKRIFGRRKQAIAWRRVRDAPESR